MGMGVGVGIGVGVPVLVCVVRPVPVLVPVRSGVRAHKRMPVCERVQVCVHAQT